MKLTENFTLEEATRSQTAARRGINNQPRPADLENIKRMARTMERVREILGVPIDVSSWYRSLALNSAIGGSPTSAHPRGLAVDFNARGLTPRQVCEKLRPHLVGLEIDQLILEFDAWVHIGLTTGRPRHQVLTIRHGTGYMAGLV